MSKVDMSADHPTEFGSMNIEDAWCNKATYMEEEDMWCNRGRYAVQLRKIRSATASIAGIVCTCVRPMLLAAVLRVAFTSAHTASTKAPMPTA